MSELFKAKILLIKRNLSLNILQLADILLVSRPTIYEWINNKDVKIRKSHENRINDLYVISRYWRNKNTDRIGAYLNEIYSFLIEENLVASSIYNAMDKAEQFILKKKRDDLRDKIFIKRHSFEEINEEEKKERSDWTTLYLMGLINERN